MQIHNLFGCTWQFKLDDINNANLFRLPTNSERIMLKISSIIYMFKPYMINHCFSLKPHSGDELGQENAHW